MVVVAPDHKVLSCSPVLLLEKAVVSTVLEVHCVDGKQKWGQNGSLWHPRITQDCITQDTIHTPDQ